MFARPIYSPCTHTHKTRRLLMRRTPTRLSSSSESIPVAADNIFICFFLLTNVRVDCVRAALAANYMRGKLGPSCGCVSSPAKKDVGTKKERGRERERDLSWKSRSFSVMNNPAGQLIPRRHNMPIYFPGPVSRIVCRPGPKLLPLYGPTKSVISSLAATKHHRRP